MAYASLGFGKHAHLTLPEVFFIDPNYFFWGIREKAFKGILAREAKEILTKIRRVRIPKNTKEVLHADHIYNERGFLGLMLVPPGFPGGYSGQFVRLPYIDLGFVHENMPDDKKGCVTLVSTYMGLLYMAYGNAYDIAAMPTKFVCEAFFNNLNPHSPSKSLISLS